MVPLAEDARCTYTTHWVATKLRWGLAVDKAEQKTLRELAAGGRTGDGGVRTRRLTVCQQSTAWATKTRQEQTRITDLQQAWSDEHRHGEQDQAVPEQKAGGTWLSRFRR